MLMDGNCTYSDDYFIMYKNIELLCCIPKTNIILYVKYNLIKQTKIYPCGNKYQDFISFYGRIILCCMDRSHFIYPFISRWTFGLFLLFVNYE